MDDNMAFAKTERVKLEGWPNALERAAHALNVDVWEADDDAKHTKLEKQKAELDKEEHELEQQRANDAPGADLEQHELDETGAVLKDDAVLNAKDCAEMEQQRTDAPGADLEQHE